MAKFYSGINTSVGIGSETLDSMLANGNTYGISPSKDIDCQDISARNVNITGVTTVTSSLYVNGKLFDGDGDFGTSGQLLSSDGTDLNWIDANTTSVANASNVGTNENSTNADQFVAFMGASSGNNPVRVDTDLKYNPSTNVLSVKGITLPGDGQKISIGADNPLEIQHSSTSGQVEIKSNANISIMSGDRVQIEDESGGNIAEFVKSSGCQLYHNVSGTPTVRLETTNDGVTISGDLTADSVQLPDLKKLELGDNQELSIFHKPDTNDVRVEVESNTNYILLTKTFDLKNAGGSKAAITATNPGGVPEVLLYHDGNERLKTTSNGVTITGTASATTFSGNLTGNATSATTAGNATSATTAGTVTTAAQPNITSLGTLTSLLLSGHLEFNSTNANCGDIISTGGHDATFGIFNSTSVSNSSGITFHCRNNVGDGYVNVADFKVGASDKIESVFKGEVTAVQPACLLTDATTVNVSNSTNNTPFGFNTIQTNVGCTVNSAKSKITVPSAGTYLVSACIAGIRTNSTVPTDSVKFILHKGGSVFPDDQTFPGGVIGTDNNEEFNFTFSLPLVLAANDELEILLINLNSSGGTATINKGYFSVTKLH